MMTGAGSHRLWEKSGARASASRAVASSTCAAVAAALFAAVAVTGCYNPSLPSGQLQCSSPGNECPKGFQCVNGFCNDKNMSVADGGGPGRSDGSSDIMGSGPGGCQGPITCSGRMDVPGKCDPVCQTNCMCQQKCTYEGSEPKCKDVREVPRQFYDECSPSNDTCRAGSICLEEVAAACKAHCYRYCRQDSDCGSDARCTGEIQLGASVATYKVCSPSLIQCNPNGAMPNCPPRLNRPFPTFACYILSAKFPDLTVCECSGSKNEGDVCQFEHECKPGFECVKIQNDARCRPLCRIGAVGVLAGGCRLGMCVPFMGADGKPSLTWGYCR